MTAVRAALPSVAGHPDPRTLACVLVVVNALAFSSTSLTTAAACALCVLVAHAIAGGGRVLTGFATWFALSAAAFAGSLLFPESSLLALLGIAGFWFFRFGIVLGTGAYVLRVVTPGELTAALSAARVPRTLRIPLIVMLRFFPLARQEFGAVRDASALRGIPLGVRAWITRPLRTTEYVLVPLLASCSRIADDLTASGLVRGLGSPKRPTSVIALRFSVADVAALVTAVGLLALWWSGVEVID